MADLLYYRREHEKYPELHETRLPFEASVILLRRLSVRHEIPLGEITATHGNRSSHYDSSTRAITLNERRGEVCALTVLHEFAHAMDDADRRRVGAIRRKWHSATHAEFVAILVRQVAADGWISEAGVMHAAAMQKAADRAASRAVREAIEKHPDHIRTKKIERRKAQIVRLERKIKSLSTRLKSARRSLAALERAAERKATT